MESRRQAVKRWVLEKFISWNVNGLRAVMGKGFPDIFASFSADIVALQETKLQRGQLELSFPGYFDFWNDAEKKGYSGTAVFTRKEPAAVRYGIGYAEHDREGRVITLEFQDYYFVTCYTPNSQDGLKRLPYRMEWERAFLQFLTNLDAKKPVILCGDLNVAHNEIDLKNPASNHFSAGFSDEEREAMSTLLAHGFIDSFRTLYPDERDRYSWWSYRTKARERNAGWRIDYFIVSERLRGSVADAEILDQVMGSDHCPVSLILH